MLYRRSGMDGDHAHRVRPSIRCSVRLSPPQAQGPSTYTFLVEIARTDSRPGHLVLTEGEEELLPADLADAKSRADFGDDRAHITAMNLKLLSRRQGLF